MIWRAAIVVVWTTAVLIFGWAAADICWRNDWTRLQLSAVGMLCKGDKL